MSGDINTICVSLATTVRQLISAIDRGARGIALMVDEERRLLATVTDGDVRRAMLAGIGLEDEVGRLVEHRRATRPTAPVTAPVGSSRDALVKMMREHSVRHIPLLDAAGRVQDLAILSDLISEPDLPVQAVVMAGGAGRPDASSHKQSSQTHVACGREALARAYHRPASQGWSEKPERDHPL